MHLEMGGHVSLVGETPDVTSLLFVVERGWHSKELNSCA